MEIKPSDFGDAPAFQLHVEVFADLVKYLSIYLLMHVNLKQIFMICWTSACCHCEHVKHTGGCLEAFSLKHAYGALHGSCCSQHTHPQSSLITQVWLASWHMWLLVNGWFIGAPSPPLPSVITQITMNVSTWGRRFLFRPMFIAGKKK